MNTLLDWFMDFIGPTWSTMLIWFAVILTLKACLYILLCILRWSLNYICRNCNCLGPILTPPGHNYYAVITGASSPVGCEFALKLSDLGFNLVLLSRTLRNGENEELVTLREEVLQRNPLRGLFVHILRVDFTSTDIYDMIEQELDTITQERNAIFFMLVNNVEMIGGAADNRRFHRHHANALQNLINTNITSVTRMSHLVLRKMIDREYRPSHDHARGVIINVSHIMGDTECPMYAAYSASKSYMNFLSKCLEKEYREHHFIVQTLTPNRIEDLDRTPCCSISSHAFVRSALRSVGVEQVCNGHPWHKFINHLILGVGNCMTEYCWMDCKYRYFK